MSAADNKRHREPDSAGGSGDCEFDSAGGSGYREPDGTAMESYRSLCTAAAGRLRAAGIENARKEAQVLLMAMLNMTAARFLALQEQPLVQLHDASERERLAAAYWSSIERRSRREPLQQILGYCDFYGLRFEINEQVLIPRQDTEILVEAVLSAHPTPGLRVLDMCTGSGCIGIALAHFGHYRVLGCDISKEALSVAVHNAQRLCEPGERPDFVCSDLFSALRHGELIVPGSLDLLVSNPPYIRRAELAQLEPEVRCYEPVLALDGDEDGLFFYRKLAQEAPLWLKPGGSLYLEIGWAQAEAVCSLLRAAGLERLCVHRDLAGLDRVVSARRGDG